MLNDASGISQVYIACGYTDMRLGIDGLASLAQDNFQLDPFHTGILFLFCGRRTAELRDSCSKVMVSCSFINALKKVAPNGSGAKPK